MLTGSNRELREATEGIYASRIGWIIVLVVPLALAGCVGGIWG